jgi:hypothetical protein
MRDYNWSRIAKWFVKAHPTQSLGLARIMLENFGREGTIVEDTHGTAIEVLDMIVGKSPESAWDEIKRYIGPPLDSRAFWITHWLRGDEHSRTKGGVLSLIPANKLWEWVDEDIKNRARYLTRMVPKALTREEGKMCLAREILVRYGDRKDVRNELAANFSTEGWMGPESSHLAAKKQYLLNFKAQETNRNVRRWIDGYVAIIDKEIHHAQVREERDEF